LDSQFLKDGKLEYRQLLSSILLIIPAFTTIIILLYNSNNIADAIIQNPDQQVTMTALLITTSQSSFSPQTSNDTATANPTTVSGTTIPTAHSVYTSQSITLPTSVKTFVWYIVDEAHENSVSEKHKKVSDHNPDYLPTNVIIPQMRTIIELKDKSAEKNDKGDLNDGIFFKDIFLRGNAVGMS
jgi:hypothetical protein